MKEITSNVVSVNIETRKSKSGNDYSMLVVEFSNGYKYNSYLNPEQVYILKELQD